MPTHQVIVSWLDFRHQHGECDPLSGLALNFSGQQHHALLPTLLAKNCHSRPFFSPDYLEMDLMLVFDADVWREGSNATIQAKETNWALRSLRAHVFAACIDGIRDAVGSWLRSLAAQELIEVVEVEREAVVPRNHALRPETLRYLAHENGYLREGGEDWVSEDEDRRGEIKGQDDNRDSCADRAANRSGRMASDARSNSEKRNIWR